jgi:hypothetical protein
MAAMTLLDSSGFRTVLHAHREAVEQQVELRVAKVLDITGLTRATAQPPTAVRGFTPAHA